MSANALECLNCIDELRSVRKDLEAGCLQKANDRILTFRPPGEWEYGRRATAHDLAVAVVGLLNAFPNDIRSIAFKRIISQRLAPLLQGEYR